MKIRMLRTIGGARDGCLYPEEFYEGEVYDLSGDLLLVFLSNKYAEEVPAVAHFANVKASLPVPKGELPLEVESAVQAKIARKRRVR